MNNTGTFEAQVYSGINNIYTVQRDGHSYVCRIKGKVLKSAEKTYNPIAVGDWVIIQTSPGTQADSWILERTARKSSLSRYNKKKRSPQVIAANADLLVCVVSVKEPPFRPRFLDRLIISAEIGSIKPLVYVNKTDLGCSREDEERLAVFKSVGYTVIAGSVLTGSGIEELKSSLQGKTVIFSGQSGVGKTSLINLLCPGMNLKTGQISAKHDRGVHITSNAQMIDTKPYGYKDNTRFIDTPGIRELDIFGIAPEQLKFCFPEIKAVSAGCAFSSCLHRQEPDCAVSQAVSQGRIHPDRYQSYLNIFDLLEETLTKEHG